MPLLIKRNVKGVVRKDLIQKNICGNMAYTNVLFRGIMSGISIKELPHLEISEKILGCCFEVMEELGPGFLENVYKNALYVTLKQKGLNVVAERSFEINFRNHSIGTYVADLIVENLIIIELKCCKLLVSEHQAQLINYLKTSGLPVGLLINFGNRKLEYKRLHHPNHFVDIGS